MTIKRGDFFSVMYHYVRPQEENSNLKYLSTKNFELQLEWLQENHGIVSREDWIAFRNGVKFPQGALLTFDDGLLDHYQYVLPILKQKGLFAIFYPCTNPLTGDWLPVHITHYLLAYVDSMEIWEGLDKFGILENANKLLNGLENTTYLYQNDKDLVKNIKRIVNWSYHQIGQVEAMYELFLSFTKISKSDFVNKWYLQESHLKYLLDANLEVGSHTCSHRVLANLNNENAKYEILESKRVLEELTTSRVLSFCYPYGGDRSFRKDFFKYLKDAGYSESFSVDYRSIPKMESSEEIQFALPRFDCNQLPYGISENSHVR